MGARVAPAMGLIAGIVFSLVFAENCFSQPGISKSQAIEGFEKLTWGVSVEQATGIYRDLYFGNYVLEDKTREPSKIFFRKQETAVIDDVVFDSIQYWFKDNRFYRIKAFIHSRIGPRSLLTRSEEAFDELHESLTRKYGAPAKFSERYFADFISVVRDVEWARGDVLVVLSYKGPEGTNEDRLTFELVKGGRP